MSLDGAESPSPAPLRQQLHLTAAWLLALAALASPACARSPQSVTGSPPPPASQSAPPGAFALPAPTGSTGRDAAPAMRSFRIYFPDQKHPNWHHTCGAVTSVERATPGEITPETVVEALLAGPTQAERSRGLIDPYAPQSAPVLAAPTGTPERLGDFFVGVRVDGKHAVMDFTASALRWLNGAACQQEAVKTALEKTLREAFGIEHVDYAIDGQVFTEWDA